ncbi:MAG: STAS domain-containing protein [Clostridiales bacterium]|nr:STAS domain-containing protein [Clostridiales bacterium]
MKADFAMMGDTLAADLSGELDHHEAAGLREEIDRTMEAFRAKNLVLSFRDVTFMDSAGIGLVVGRYNTVSAAGGTLWITDCSPYIHRILEMAGVFTLAREESSKELLLRRLQLGRIERRGEEHEGEK